MACVYKHTNRLNGKIYIGYATNYKKRWASGYSSKTYFGKAILKYGWDNFDHEILIDNLTEVEAQQKEVELIAKFRATDPSIGYNLTKGGEGVSGYKHTEESRLKRKNTIDAKYTKEQQETWLCLAHAAYNPGNTGHKHSKEAKEKMRKAHLGRIPVNKGIKMTDEQKRKIVEFNRNRVWTDEQRNKLRQIHLGKSPANKGVKMTDDEKKKLKELRRSKQYDFQHMLTYKGETHSVSEWAEILNIPHTTLFSRIKRGLPVEKILDVNRSVGKSYTFNNETHTLMEWATILNVPVNTLYGRLHRNLPYDKVFTGKNSHWSRLSAN